MQVAGSGGVGGVSPSRVVERSASGLRIVRSLPDGTALLHSASQSAPGLPKPRPIELSCKSISLSCAIALGLEFSCAVPNMCSMPIGWARRDAHCPHTLEPGPRPDAQGHHPQLPHHLFRTLGFSAEQTYLLSSPHIWTYPPFLVPEPSLPSPRFFDHADTREKMGLGGYLYRQVFCRLSSHLLAHRPML